MQEIHQRQQEKVRLIGYSMFDLFIILLFIGEVQHVIYFGWVKVNT
jgi:hypothetical protein